MMPPVLAHYRNGGFDVTILANGTKIRERISSQPPLWPETMDLKITDWCDAGCAWCHEGSTKRGRHGNPDAILNLLRPLPPGIEIAIGGGDPMSHPDFDRLVRGLHDIGLIANVTINGRHLERHRPRLDRLIDEGVINGVGVSIYKTIPAWNYEHLVLHMIAGVDDPAMLENIERKKILILGYKTFGRGSRYQNRHEDAVTARIAQWRRELLWISRAHHLSFDTLAIEQLEPRRLFRSQADYDRRFMGEEGQFSMYVDGVEQEYGIASYAPDRHTWTSIAKMFAHVRSGSAFPPSSHENPGATVHGFDSAP